MTIPNTYADFELTTENISPPKDWPEALKSLWFATKGNWKAAHDIAQDIHSDLGSWIHAYLHREEGDAFNAGYWYRRAGKSVPKISLEEELREITEAVLAV